MEEKYFAEVIEEKWQKIWAEKGTFHAEIDHTRPKFFALEMLPYPSGNLHMGHVRNYSIGDALAWYKRLKGFNVLHPIGWDSFGQPAEAAAIKRGVNPRDWTETNIEHMNGQLMRLGLSYDWRRQIFAHRPDYYKFDQWFFLKMFEKGIAYKKATQVNWCPSCETTLSNEQASGGICWRCGSATTKTDLNQWFFKITDYADQLLDDMSEIESGWAEKVLKRQRDWIGRSEGAFVEFEVSASESIRVFTTRIDTIYGVNAIVVAAEHPIIEASFETFSSDVKTKIEEIRAEKLKATDREVELEKDGIDTGLKAINPFSQEEIPIWVGNYVMMEYGTGAVMSVPAHDERDFEFAKKYNLPIRQVVVKETDLQLLKTACSEEVELFENPKLSEREQIIQENTFAYLQENVETLIEKYYAKHGKQIINADRSKELFAEYNENRLENDRAVQPTASALTRLILKRRLNELPPGSTVVLTAGGQASGKSVIIAEYSEADLIYDSVMASANGNRKVLDLIADKGHFALIIYVYRQIEFAVIGMLKRQKLEGRPVSEDNMASGHFGSQQSFINDTDEYAKSKLGFIVEYVETIENNLPKRISLNELKERAYNNKQEVFQKIIYGINEYNRNEQRSNFPIGLTNSQEAYDTGRIRGLGRESDATRVEFQTESADGNAGQGRSGLGLAAKNAGKRTILEAFTDYGRLINSGDWKGKSSETAKVEMSEFAKGNGFGETATTYRLRDWGVSRQRFWGSPIPIIYCDSCGVVPEKVENLPIELPETAPFTGVGESPLAKVPEFVNVECPKCGEPAKRETDTMDTFVDSCWYYFRYCDNQNSELPFSQEVADYWLPVDQYIGGDDHAVMHLIYTRFWTKMMRDIGLVKFNEPVKRLLTQGMVIGETFFDDDTGKKIYFPPNTVSVKRDEKGKLVSATSVDGKTLKTAVERMSKSKGNGVDPDEMVEIYGADASRLFVLFAAPAENELLWKEEGVEGTKRFLQRVYRFVWKWRTVIGGQLSVVCGEDFSAEAKKLRRKTHQTIQRIEESFETLQFNTPVAALMELSNALGDWKIEPSAANSGDLFAIREGLESLILMLAPFAPHFAEEMYAKLVGNDNGILANGGKFPEFKAELAKADEIEIPIQINGKLRSKVIASPETPNAELEKMALADEKVKEWIDGKEIVKIVVVPKRLVNIVVK
jgi:leucyl-tRNA synthetase